MKRIRLLQIGLPILLILALFAAAALSGGRYSSRGGQDTMRKWRPRIENYQTQSYVPVVTADALETPFYFERATAPLTTLTSVGGGDSDVIHPDWIHVPEGFGGYPWWMVATPYAGSDSQLENPEIWYSVDGDTWTAIAGNPIDASPGGANDFNCDPCLMLDNGRLYCYYRSSIYDNPNYDMNIVCRSSTDGLTWSDEVTILGPIDSETENIMSPQVRNVNGTYYLWTVDNVPATHRVRRRSCSSPTGTFASVSSCAITSDAGEKTEIFHIHILWDGKAFYGLWKVNASPSQWLFARSIGGVSWDLNGVPINAGNADGWDEVVYQASIIKRPGYPYFDVLYSAYDDETVDLHRVGRGKLHWSPFHKGVTYGYTESSGVAFTTFEEGRIRVRSGAATPGGAVINMESKTAETGAGYDPRIHFKAGASPATKVTIGVDLDDANALLIGTTAVGTGTIIKAMVDGGVMFPNIKSGVDQAAAKAAAGEIYIDTDDQTLKVGTL